MKWDAEEIESLAAALFEKLAPVLAGDRPSPRALMSCAAASKDLGISPEKVRALVEAGFIDRVQGFKDIYVSPEALAKYRNTAAPK